MNVRGSANRVAGFITKQLNKTPAVVADITQKWFTCYGRDPWYRMGRGLQPGGVLGNTPCSTAWACVLGVA